MKTEENELQVTAYQNLFLSICRLQMDLFEDMQMYTKNGLIDKADALLKVIIKLQGLLDN